MAGRGSAELPGVQDRDESLSIVMHVDMDCFYAACERLRNPELRDEPVVIGMGYDRGEPSGAVATASYEARRYGVESAMPISEALESLPRRNASSGGGNGDETAYYLPVDMEYYKGVSNEVREILNEYADVLEPVGIDEAYLDVSTKASWNNVQKFAEELKQRIEGEVGVTASIGVAPTKSAAKIASDYDKPDGLVVVNPGEVEEFLAPLKIEAVHGIGPVTAEELRGIGVETAGDLAEADIGILEEKFGSRGRELRMRALGHDSRAVSPPDDPKSMSREKSFTEPISDLEEKRQHIKRLVGDVAERAHERGALYRTIGIKVVTPPFNVNTRERSLSGPVDDPEVVEAVTQDLIEEFSDDEIRKLGVRVSNLVFSSREQVTLEEWEGTNDAGSGVDRWFLKRVEQDEDGWKQLTLPDFID